MFCLSSKRILQFWELIRWKEGIIDSGPIAVPGTHAWFIQLLVAPTIVFSLEVDNALPVS